MCYAALADHLPHFASKRLFGALSILPFIWDHYGSSSSKQEAVNIPVGAAAEKQWAFDCTVCFCVMDFLLDLRATHTTPTVLLHLPGRGECCR